MHVAGSWGMARRWWSDRGDRDAGVPTAEPDRPRACWGRAGACRERRSVGSLIFGCARRDGAACSLSCRESVDPHANQVPDPLALPPATPPVSLEDAVTPAVRADHTPWQRVPEEGQGRGRSRGPPLLRLPRACAKRVERLVGVVDILRAHSLANRCLGQVRGAPPRGRHFPPPLCRALRALSPTPRGPGARLVSFCPPPLPVPRPATHRHPAQRHGAVAARRAPPPLRGSAPGGSRTSPRCADSMPPKSCDPLAPPITLRDPPGAAPASICDRSLWVMVDDDPSAS